MEEQEYNQKLLKSTYDVPAKIEINGALRIPCHHYPQCNTVRFSKNFPFRVTKRFGLLEVVN